MKPSEILDKAADIIVRDGWHQGSYFETDPNATAEEDAELAKTAPCCQDGAILRAVYGTAWPTTWQHGESDPKKEKMAADEYMIGYVKKAYGVGSPIAWNDRSTTTKDDVVTALRGAANNAREAGE